VDIGVYFRLVYSVQWVWLTAHLIQHHGKICGDIPPPLRMLWWLNLAERQIYLAQCYAVCVSFLSCQACTQTSRLHLSTSRKRRSCLISGTSGTSIGVCWLLLPSDDEFGFLLPGVGIECAVCLGHRSMTSPRGCGGVRHGVKYGCVPMQSMTGFDLQSSDIPLRWYG